MNFCTGESQRNSAEYLGNKSNNIDTSSTILIWKDSIFALLSFQLLKKEKCLNVLKLTDSLLKYDPNSFYAYYSKGFIFSSLGDYESAIRNLKISLNLKGKTDSAYYIESFLGRVFEANGNKDSAMAYYKIALKSLNNLRKEFNFKSFRYERSRLFLLLFLKDNNFVLKEYYKIKDNFPSQLLSTIDTNFFKNFDRKKYFENFRKNIQ